jgi:hypothetical protein
MADIGAQLREARMRARIDITDMEVETKIRAKYLRALENEEWDALPGPTYVKSFLRTYADALGLDAKRVVEEYKLRHERPADADLHPIRPPSARDRRRRDQRRRGVPIGLLIGVVLIGILGALYALGLNEDGDRDAGRAVGTGTGTTERRGEAREPARERRRPRRGATGTARRTVSLRLVPTGQVNVCLVNAGGDVLVRGQTITEPTRLFRSRSFRLVVGNNAVRLRVNGRDRGLPPSSEPIARRISRTGGRAVVRFLPAGQRPTCG